MNVKELPDRVWLVKYALSEGIRECRVLDWSEDGQRARLEGYAGFVLFGLGKDITLALDEAQRVAEAMRSAKLKSLRKQLKKLETHQFPVHAIKGKDESNG